MNDLKMKFNWEAILTLSEDYDIDLFLALQDPMAGGVKRLIDIMFVGATTVDPDITREDLVAYLKGRGGSIGEELKFIFEEIAKSLPSEDDSEEG